MSQLFSHHFYTEMSLFSHNMSMFGWNVASDVWFKKTVTNIESPKHQENHIGWANNKTPRGKVGCCSAAVPNLPVERVDFWWFAEFPRFQWIQRKWKHGNKFWQNHNKQIHHELSAAFSIEGNFHCLGGTQKRVSLTNAPCSKLFWPLTATEVAWKSTRSLRLQSKREL